VTAFDDSFQVSPPVDLETLRRYPVFIVWSATEFLTFASTSTGGRAAFLLTPRTDCGSTAVRCQAASATDRAAPSTRRSGCRFGRPAIKVVENIGNGGPAAKTINESGGITGGEAGIRTLGRGLSPYNGLANRRFRPLSHLTARLQVYVTTKLTRKRSLEKR
jgi:hypothetical protein